MLDSMLKNLLLGFGVTEADVAKAKVDFTGFCDASQQIAQNQKAIFESVNMLRAELQEFRNEIRGKTDGAEYPEPFDTDYAILRDQIITPHPVPDRLQLAAPTLTVEEKEPGEHAH